MKYARIVENCVQEIFIEEDGKLLADNYHPDLAKFFQEIPDYVDSGFVLIDGVWTAPTEAPPLPEQNLEPEI